MGYHHAEFVNLMHILFFGDSITHGSLGVGYVQSVATAFPAHRVTSAGVNGDTTYNLLRRVEHDVLARRPDACFILVGINDALSHAEPAARPYYRLGKGVPRGHITPDLFRENLAALLDRLSAAGVRVWAGLPPIETRPDAVAALRGFNSIAAALCAARGIPALDLMAAMTPAQVPERPAFTLGSYRDNFVRILQGPRGYEHLAQAGGYTYSFDGIHLTTGGAAQLGALVIDFLRRQGVA